jgi:DNA-binding MarR family transcriptional regulator
MGNTLSGLESRGFVQRSADPHDGRRIIMSVTDSGREMLRDKRDLRNQQIAAALAAGFTPAELDALRAAAPLLERLAEQL